MSLAPISVYIQALTTGVTNNSCVGLADALETVSHDSLQRVIRDGHQINELFRCLVNRSMKRGGYLILDDTILEKYTRGLEAIKKLLDTKTNGYVLGLNVVLLCWSDGKTTLPIAFFIYQGKEVSKLELARKLLHYAQALGCKPKFVLFDSWYAAQTLLKAIRALGWHFVTRLKKNRYLSGKKLKSFHRHPYWQEQGKLRGDIEVKVFRRASKFYATYKHSLSWASLKALYRIRAEIEEVFRVLKQECAWQGCQQRSLRHYYRHLTLGLIAFYFLKSLQKRFKLGVYILRRKLISRKLSINLQDIADFLQPA